MEYSENTPLHPFSLLVPFKMCIRDRDYIREGLIGYYTGRGRSNTDENKNILPDLSGNGKDLENKNFAYTVDSGYGAGYIQYRCV